MRYQLDLRSLAYLVCGPLLVAGLFGLLTAIHVPSTTTVDEASCGTVLDHSDYQLLDTRTADASRVTRRSATVERGATRQRSSA